MDDQFCCACLLIFDSPEIKTLSSIFDKNDCLTYAECIMQMFTNVELNDEHYLCESCILEMKTSFTFYKKVTRSQSVLKELERKSNTAHEHDSIVKSLPEMNEETIEVESLCVDYQLEEKNLAEEHADVEESYENSEEIKTASDSDDFYEELAESMEAIENEADLESAQIVENLKSSDEIFFQQIEITPVETRNINEKDSTSLSTQNNIIEKQRKRFFGKFSCDYCDKLFPNHSRMIIHRRSHEPDRPKYACNECGRIYSTNQALDVHIRGVHKMSGNACKICSKVFPSQASLTVHMRFHSKNFPYVCETCGQKFAQLCHLNTHRKVKHNRVRFCCNHPNCGKFFTSTASLRNHEFSHSIMPFECEFCHRGYPAKAKLKVHVRKAHKKELTLDELEPMRKFHVMRSKPNIIQVEISSLQKAS